MFGSSTRTIIQTQTSKTTYTWVTEHNTKLLLRPSQSSDLNPVEDEWGELKKHRHGSVNLKIWSDSGWRNVSDLSSGVLWPEPCRRWVSELKKHRHGSVNLKIWSDSGWRNVSDLSSGVLWPEPCRTWVSELKKHRHGSVNLKDLEWFWMKECLWSLVRCSLTWTL